MPPGGDFGGHQPPGSGGGGLSEDGRMKRASTACKECQKRRTRCSGDPCTECQAHQRNCVFDELSDRRRKASAKKTQEELNSLRDFVDQLLAVFRGSDNRAVQHLINTIRAGASQDDIRILLLQMNRQPPNTHLPGASHPHSGLDPNMMNEHMSHFYDHR
ncbi:uncharacterized protein N7459_004129 [Penicillium hispanicum]|uniref:uncharacterized protein n=1 Tax=Penicillium hispanicum TaxID=1080232 RepID=UPI002541087B|nr:uncharacterized protein N7459_004129 [Penicillium hispanicum]KAJ5584329.1 hypothetical protein N7459_004129 [Penicillium hispanicum]